MGAWGSGPFDNDDAADFLGELIEVADWSVAAAALDAVLATADEYLEAPESSMAIAAAAIVAHSVGGYIADLAPEDAPAIAALGAPPAELLIKAKAALVRIRKQSELADLWEEAAAKDEWMVTLDSIEKAL